jgi:sigma54-dependent transcription regulator
MNVPTFTDHGSQDEYSPHDLEGVQLLDGTAAIVRSPPLRNVMALLQRAAQHKASVLIVGETGSGKELVARAIHHYSRRCGARSSMSTALRFQTTWWKANYSATRRAPLAERKVPLFLDEVGELEPKVQVKLLRVLDGVPYYRLGGNRKVSVDVRIVAAGFGRATYPSKAGEWRPNRASRKLKLYQEEAKAERELRFGALSYEQQRYFRVVTEFPVIVRRGDKQAHATSVNLSRSGIALRSPNWRNSRLQ